MVIKASRLGQFNIQTRLLLFIALEIMALLICLSIWHGVAVERYQQVFKQYSQIDLPHIYQLVNRGSWQTREAQSSQLALLTELPSVSKVVLKDEKGTILDHYSAASSAHHSEFAELTLSVALAENSGQLELNVSLPEYKSWVYDGGFILLLSLLAFILLASIIYYLTKPWYQQLQHAKKIAHALGQVEATDESAFSHGLLAMNKLLKMQSAEHIRHAEQVRRRTYLDRVTGLANRVFFDAQLEVMLSHQQEAVKGVLLLMQFSVKEQYDEVTAQQESIHQELAIVLSNNLAVGNEHLLARRSGCDYAMLLNQVTLEKAKKIAEKIIADIQRLHMPDFVDMHQCMHIGMACYSTGRDSYALLSEADMALRTAQLHGENNVFAYTEGQLSHQQMKGSVRWRTLFEQIFINRTMQLFYQPVMSAVTGKVLQYEVLSRIQDEHGEVIPATLFIPMAKQLGFAEQFDRLMLDTVFKKCCYEDGFVSHQLSINLSVANILDIHFREWLIQRLATRPAISECLWFEISECAVANNLESLSAALIQIKEMGCHIIIDHVGQPDISLDYLNTLPVDVLKLHNSMIRNIDVIKEHQLTVETIVEAGHQLGIGVWAEGVESVLEWKALVELGIDAGQGYYFAIPKADF